MVEETVWGEVLNPPAVTVHDFDPGSAHKFYTVLHRGGVAALE